MTTEDLFCAAESRRVGEPIVGTASKDGLRFLLVESDEAWGRDAFASSTLSNEVKDRLSRAAESVPRTRIAFVRPVGRVPARPRLYLTAGPTRGVRTFVRALDSFDSVVDLPLESMLLGEPDEATTVLDRPLVLVCTHGKRDRCCAKHGVALATRLADEDGMLVLQSSHLGGHRFAAVVVTLPDGLAYGHLDDDDAPALARAVRERRTFDPARFRGRSGYDEPVQVADARIRLERDLGADALLELASVSKSERGAHVTMTLGAETFETTVRKRLLLDVLRPASCFEEPSPSYAFDVVTE